jgi:hypothetical protein
MADGVTAATDVPLTCEEAFALFSSGLGSWWPPAFSWSQDGLEAASGATGRGPRATRR